jgi:hypothetical protein
MYSGNKMSGYVPKNAIGDEVKFPPKETLAIPKQPEIGPEPSPEYPTATQHLDNLFNALELLEMETSALFAQIDNALAEEGPQCEPVASPRISNSNSNLTYRIANATDLVELLTYRVNSIRRRITL